jgi:hypothetical protein
MIHADRIAELRAEVDAECIRRWEKIMGRNWSEGERLEYDASVSDGLKKSRTIEDSARRAWRNLTRAVRDGERYLASCDPEKGEHIAAALAKAVPNIKEAMRLADRDAVTSGEAAFVLRKRTRITFIRDELFFVAVPLTGASDPFALEVPTLAVFTLLSRAFWPYSKQAMLRFGKIRSGKKQAYPTASEVIRKEAEEIRKRLPTLQPH